MDIIRVCGGCVHTRFVHIEIGNLHALLSIRKAYIRPMPLAPPVTNATAIFMVIIYLNIVSRQLMLTMTSKSSNN
tara:strand:- start:257 stop:481 length:225 start_codon:yes stop_codon:yes gene_type:complete